MWEGDQCGRAWAAGRMRARGGGYGKACGQTFDRSESDKVAREEQELVPLHWEVPMAQQTIILPLVSSCRCRVDVHPATGHHVNFTRLLLHHWPVYSARSGLRHPPVALATVNRVHSLLCLLRGILVCGPRLLFTSLLRPSRTNQEEPMPDQAG